MKKLILAISAVALLAGCRTVADAGFFTFTGPDGFGLCEITDTIPAKIVLATNAKKLEQIGDMTGSKGYISIDWHKGLYSEGSATNALGFGTIPGDAEKVSDGTKPIDGVLSWEETIVILDNSKKSEQRWLYRVAIPLDGGLVEIVASIMPGKRVLEDVKSSIGAIKFSNKQFFGGK